MNLGDCSGGTTMKNRQYVEFEVGAVIVLILVMTVGDVATAGAGVSNVLATSAVGSALGSSVAAASNSGPARRVVIPPKPSLRSPYQPPAWTPPGPPPWAPGAPTWIPGPPPWVQAKQQLHKSAQRVR
jgi:hypothetical protein